MMNAVLCGDGDNTDMLENPGSCDEEDMIMVEDCGCGDEYG